MNPAPLTACATGGTACPDEAMPHLAPYVVVRAARWPLGCLQALCLPCTADDAPTAGSSAAAHERRLLDELRILWQATLGCAQFRCALAAAHPTLFRRLRSRPLPEKWNKAARQVAVTLYQQLARACWRTEPCALWSGVGSAALRPEDAQEPSGSGACVVVEPTLQPFAEILSSMAKRSTYRWIGRFVLHARTRRVGPGEWRVSSRDDAGVWRERAVDVRAFDAPLVDRCIEHFADLGPVAHDVLLRAASHGMGSDVQARRLLDHLADAGLITGGPALPNAFETAWLALDQASEFLHDEDRSVWRGTIGRLRSLCDGLQARHGSMDADEICAADEEAGRLALALSQRCGLASITVPRAWLHWTAGLPAPMRLDAPTGERLERAVRAHERLRAADDPASALDALHARALDRGEAQALHEVLRGCGDARDLGRRLDELACPPILVDRLCDRDRARASGAAMTSPFGFLAMRAGRQGLLLGASGTEPWLAYGRFGALLGGSARHGHPLHRWCDQSMRQFTQTTGARIAQVFAACPTRANLLAQPRFSAAHCIDIDGTTPGALAVSRLAVCSDGRRRWLRSPADPSPLCAIGFSAIDLGRHDPVLERLMLTGWRHRPPVPAARLREGPEVGEPFRIDRDLLGRRPGWRVSGARAAALARSEPLERWRHWRLLADALALPELVTVSRGGAPGLPLPRDSALAAEVMLRARADEPPWFDIEAPDDECLLETPDGQRHATEFIALFARHRHDWSRHDVDLDPVPDSSGAAAAARRFEA